jgi:hypothetical protein
MRYCLRHACAWVPDAATGWSHGTQRPQVRGHWEPFPLDVFAYAHAFGQAFGCVAQMPLDLHPCPQCYEEMPCLV